MKSNIVGCIVLGLLTFSAHAQLRIAPKTPDTPSAPNTPGRGAVVADYIQVVASEFVINVYQNGKLVPASQDVLLKDIFGAQVERVNITVRPGDWIVFNVAQNGLRPGFPPYFAVAGMTDDGHAAFVSETDSGNWSACDSLQKVVQFISDRDDAGEGSPRRLRIHWGDGDKEISQRVPGWNGEPIWGNSNSTWLKYVALPAAHRGPKDQDDAQ